MSDLGNLAHCVVDGDPRAIEQARLLRGRSLAAALVLEGLAVATLLLWPLLTLGVLPSQHLAAPVPVFHSAPPANPEPVRAAQQTAQSSPHWGVAVLHQPPSMPTHVFTGGDAPAIAETWPGDNLPEGSPLGNRSADGPARPEGTSRATERVKISGGVMNALLVHRVQPEYPETARMIHLSGTVQLRAVIGTDGAVRDIQVLSGNILLVHAAVAAVQQWRYQPTRLSGEPVEVETLITVQFQMQ